MTMNTVHIFNLTIFCFVIKQYYEVKDQISYVKYPYITFIVLGGNSHFEKIMNLLIHMNIVSMCLQYYIKNQQDATLAVLFISKCEITLHVSDSFCVHHQEC